MFLKSLCEYLCQATSTHEKISLLDALSKVREFLQKTPQLSQFLSTVSSEYELVCKQLIAIGQLDRMIGDTPLQESLLRALLEKMVEVDSFYKELGGLVGYQAKILELLDGPRDIRQSEIVAFHAPNFIDITEESPKVIDMIWEGICSLPKMSEMYPLGGAADRLHLVDEKTGDELPAAKLNYEGKTLLERLIRDLSAREFLYFKLHGVQLQTPIVVMTSLEKNNHRHVCQIFEEHNWFGRRKELVRMFTQPLVPTVDRTGNWCLSGSCTPLLKPGGHGALWKLARDTGVFNWLKQLQKKAALIRQINNPIAALDYGLLAFTGFGIKNHSFFGFSSCPRLLRTAEGVNVIIEKKNGEVALTNIEYCDFTKFGIEDSPLKDGEPYSRFSSNTNILFADLQAIEQAVQLCPFPGLLVNLKTSVFSTSSGEKKQQSMARLESTMQNIADVFVESKQKMNEVMRTFVTYNHRHKTISTAKKAFIPGQSTRETPEECFYVQLQNAREVLAAYCGFDLPSKYSLGKYLLQGPDVAFTYHPALGPLYSLIAQKIGCGKIAEQSEMQLEIADLYLENLELDGSLRIHASQPIGHFDVDGILQYSNRTGRCILKNVSVRNAGVNWMKSQPYWKYDFVRHESFEIHLHGFSEFIAENISFQGAFCFHVPDGVRMRVEEREGKLYITKEKLEEGPFWQYYWEHGVGLYAVRLV